MSRTLTTREAAALLGVYISTARRWADEGRLPHTLTPGGHRRFDRYDLEAWAVAHGTRRDPGFDALRAEVWARAASKLLRAAEADLGPEAAAPFAAAREALGRAPRPALS